MLFSGCAADRLHREGLRGMDAGKYEEAVQHLERAVEADPRNLRYLADLRAGRERSVEALLSQGQRAQAAKEWTAAEGAFNRVLIISPGNARALAALDLVSREKRHADILRDARSAYQQGDSDRALGYLGEVLRDTPNNVDARNLKQQIDEQQARLASATPTLKSIYRKPVNLEFRDANLKMVFEVLSRSTAINFILDKDVRSDARTTVFLRQASLEDAVDMLLTTNQLEKKVLNASTVLIYPNTPNKLKEYQDLLIRTFFLANADAKQTASLVKTVLKSRDIFVDEKLNMMVMRDTPEAIRLAEKLVALHDVSEPEMMLEVEVLEIKRSRLLDLGVKLPDQVTFAPLAGQSALSITELRNLNADRITATGVQATVNLRKDDSDVNLLANPRIRVKNREKAKILIGDKVPVITTTSTATGFVSESIQYVEVGLKLDVEPTAHLYDEVTMKVGLEVSSIVREVRTNSGSLSYQIGTRNASSVLRLKDGETQILAGLISDEERRTATKLPALGDLPLIGRLFSSQRDDRQKTEIVLSLTPRLVRPLRRPDPRTDSFWSGSEATLRTKPFAFEPMPVEAPKVAIAKAAAAVPVVPVATPQIAAVKLLLSGPAKASAGDEIKVSLRASEAGAIRALPVQLEFDREAMELMDVLEGDFFRQAGGKSQLTSNIDIAKGKINLVASRSDEGTSKGEGEIAVLRFKITGRVPALGLRVVSATSGAAQGSVSDSRPQWQLPLSPR